MREGWATTTLGDVMMLERSRIEPKKIDPDAVYVGLENLESDRPTLRSFGRIGDTSSAATPFVPDDVLFGKLRPYLRKVAIAEVAGFSTTEILVMRATSRVIPQFLLYLATQPSTFRRCEEASAGTRMPRVSAKDLSAIGILLPPLAEQRRIVDVIESVDTYITALETRAETARNARSALLHDLLSNPGPDCRPFRVKDLAVERGLIGGPFGSDLVANDYVENGVPVIRGQNLPNSKRFVGGDFVYVSKSKADELRRNQALPGDIIATQRGTLGQVAIVPQQAFDRYVISQSQMRLRVDLDVALPDFVYLWLDWSDTRAAIDSRRSATANPHINLRIFGELAGVLPPVTKQREIIDLIAPIDEFESHLDQSTELSRNFRSALLSDLLSGSHEVPASYDELMGAA